MNVKLIKMQSGEDVVCEVIQFVEGRIIIANPIVMVPQAGGQVGFAPWSPFLEENAAKELSIRESYTVYVADAKPEVVKNYTEIFSPIITPSNAGKIIT